MRKAICYSDPSTAIAGSECCWSFVYIPSEKISKGSLLKFDILSSGRGSDWVIPKSSGSDDSEVWIQKDSDGRMLPMIKKDSNFEIELPYDVESGDRITIFIGAMADGELKATNRTQTYIQRKRPFNLFVECGKDIQEENFSIDVKGAPLFSINVVIPSTVGKGKRFDVVVRFEDQFGNLTNNAPEDTMLSVKFLNVPTSMDWKLFLPDSGFIKLPNLYFNEPGIYKLELTNLKDGSKFYSDPIKCYNSIKHDLLWGLLHGESDENKSHKGVEESLRHFRDSNSFNFYSMSPFSEDVLNITEADWNDTCLHIDEFCEDDRFISFFGVQSFQEKNGLHHLVYNGKSYKKDPGEGGLEKLYKRHTKKELLSIPCSTMSKACSYDFSSHNDEFSPVVEIYNSWGSSECTKKEGNWRPFLSEKEEGSIRKALNDNVRLGFVAGGMDTRGAYADMADDQMQYSAGFTAVLTPNHSRNAIFDALHSRACYATTGARIVIGLYIASEKMGSELSTSDKAGLKWNRYIEGYVAGTDTIDKIEIIRNGELWESWTPDSPNYSFEIDDSEPLESMVIEKDDKSFAYYYMRVLQKDGHIAWSSPIWIDLDK